MRAPRLKWLVKPEYTPTMEMRPPCARESDVRSDVEASETLSAAWTVRVTQHSSGSEVGMRHLTRPWGAKCSKVGGGPAACQQHDIKCGA